MTTALTVFLGALTVSLSNLNTSVEALNEVIKTDMWLLQAQSNTYTL